MASFPLLLLLASVGVTLAHNGTQQVTGPANAASSPGDHQALLDLVQKHMTALAEDFRKQKYGSPPWIKYRDAEYSAEALRQYIAMAVNPGSVWHDQYSKNEDRIWNEHELAVQERDSSRQSIYRLYDITLRGRWHHSIDHVIWNEVVNKTLENRTSCVPDLPNLHERYHQANAIAEAMRQFMAAAIQPQSIWETYYDKNKNLLLNNYINLVEKRDQLWQLLEQQGHEHSPIPVSQTPTAAPYNPFSGNPGQTTRPSGNTNRSTTPHPQQAVCEDSDIACEFLGPAICTEMANYSRESCERTCHHCNASDTQVASSNTTENCSSSLVYDFEMWMKIYKAYQVAVNNQHQNSHRHVYHSRGIPLHRPYDQLDHYSPNMHYHSESPHNPREPDIRYHSHPNSNYHSGSQRHYNPRPRQYHSREPISHHQPRDSVNMFTESEEEGDQQIGYYRDSDDDYGIDQSQSNEDRRDYYSERMVDFVRDDSSERVEDFEY